MEEIVRKQVRVNTILIAVNIVCLLFNTCMLRILLNDGRNFMSALIGIAMFVSILAISCLLRVRGKLGG